MTIEVDWSNPYAEREGTWYRGNLHTHTDEGSSCGSVPIARVLQMYHDSGLDFLAVSDHMYLSEPEHDGLIFIPGIEWNGPRGVHTGVISLSRDTVKLAIGIEEQPELLRRLAEQDALVILNHPNWQLVPHYRREQLYDCGPFDGIEIYNGVIERLPGYAIATDKWDALLMNGQRVLGFAADDSHTEEDIGRAWIGVRAAEPTAESIFRAMQRGNLYASCGVVLTDMRREGSVITVESENAQEIQVLVDGGRRIAAHQGASLAFDTSTCPHEYVRFTAHGPGASMAWTQPFFLNG